MKNIYGLLFCLVMLLGVKNVNAQSISVSGTVFLPRDTIAFTYSTPSFTSSDWIGIYKVDQTPGENTPSIVWKYILAESGTLYLDAPDEAGSYKAVLLCCDGYNVVATTAEFSIQKPSFNTSFPIFVEGDSIVFNYTSPRFSSTDKISIYPSEVIPGTGVQPLDWKYIPSATGTLSFKTALNVGMYDAYLLCCDGNDSIAKTSFEVKGTDEVFLVARQLEFASGASIELTYNDPSFAAGDRVSIYVDGEIPGNNALTYSQLTSKSGIVSFPGVFSEGAYFAVLSAAETEYTRSDAFVVLPQTGGSYVKPSAAVYPTNSSIFVNYKDENINDKDWLGIYKKGNNPGGVEPTLKSYLQKDSSTIEFNELPVGEYVVYLFCCDGYTIKAKSDFKVVGLNTPTLVLGAFSYAVDETIELIYNDPDFDSGANTDWIGIYHPGDLPSSVRSMIWDYLPQQNGTMSFSVPYLNGTWPEENAGVPLEPGEYVAYLFCCDTYGVYASTNFVITEFPSEAKTDLNSEDILNLFPNPTTGLVNIKLKDGKNMLKIYVYNLTGQVLYEESAMQPMNEKVLNLKLNKGVYFLEILTGNHWTSKKLIIQ